jgi:phage N-6-adenine-methyltransferase
MSQMDIHYSSKKSDWETPDDFFEVFHEILKFDLDVCAREDNSKLPNFISPEMDSFKTPWTGCCWMNPPYGRGTKDTPGTGDWVRLAVDNVNKGNCDRAVILIPSRTDTKYFQQLIFKEASWVFFVAGRLKFGGSKDSAPFPSAVIGFGKFSNDEIDSLSELEENNHGSLVVL